MSFSFSGIKKIRIPVKEEQILANAEAVLKEWLNVCLQLHTDNQSKEKILREYFGGIQDIKFKERAYGQSINNKIVENHALAQVEFKVGFLLGDKPQITQKSDVNVDDIMYLDRFLSSAGFYSQLKTLKRDVYMLGIGTTFIAPNTDIIDEKGKYIAEYDKDHDAPFMIDVVDPEFNFVVYSSYNGCKPLFCVNIIPLNINSVDFKFEVNIYTRKKQITYKTEGLINGNLVKITEKNLVVFKTLPIIEHVANAERLGIIEKNKDLFDSINSAISSSADAIASVVDNIFVFEGVDVEADDVKDMIAAGAIQLPQGGKVTTIDIEYNHADINVYYEQRVTKAYDIAGVPIASGMSTSGGDTGKARLLGGGWENAYTKIKGDIIGMESSDFKMLEQIIELCKTVPNTKLNEINATQIEMNYNINPNDNILAKAQALKYLYEMNMPADMSLKMTNLSMDIHTDSQKWDMEKEKNKEVTANVEP